MRNYLIIGGTSGIGARIAELLSQENKVYTLSRNKPKKSPSNTTHMEGDVTSGSLNFDGLPDALDGLAYCPGTINLKPFHSLKIEDFENDFRINVTGAVQSLQLAYQRLKAGDNPGVVLFSTIAVRKGMHFHSSIAAAKGAVEGLVRSLASEWAPSIRVNAIAPSLTDTPLASRLLSSKQRLEAAADRHPLKRIGQPGDIASLAAYLMGTEAGWITGQVFGVDGGLSTLQT